MDIGRRLTIQSTIEYPSLFKAKDWLQNNSFQRILLRDQDFIIHNSTNLKKEKSQDGFSQNPKNNVWAILC